MIKLLASLLGILDKLFGAWTEHRWKQKGREETTEEMNDEINRQVELGEAAIIIPDPERTEQLRNRFDRSRK